MPFAKIIDGRNYAKTLCERIASEVHCLKKQHNIIPGLSVILVGNSPASQIYVQAKNRQATALEMKSCLHTLPENTTEEKLVALIHSLNKDITVHGILVQLPLPGHIRPSHVVNAIHPDKDVDGFHNINKGKLLSGNKNAMIPCTPLGCLYLLKKELGKLEGLEAVILGRSDIVGKPMAFLLLSENCSVTILHSKTRHIDRHCRRADILVAAVGKPLIVKEQWVKPGATVIDVGINRLDSTLKTKEKKHIAGDVDFDNVCKVASRITPVPGGVGPMTISMLLRNTLIATYQQAGIALKTPRDKLFS